MPVQEDDEEAGDEESEGLEGGEGEAGGASESEGADGGFEVRPSRVRVRVNAPHTRRPCPACASALLWLPTRLPGVRRRRPLAFDR